MANERAAVEEGPIAVDDARELRPRDLDDELARELAAATAADLAELVELARHLDHRLRHGAGLPDPDPATTELASPSTVQIDGEAMIEAMHVALGEAERASIDLRGALERAHHLAEQLRRI
ncbi:MAG: hypothetical protein ACYC2O_03660 [Microthrixaceae bacterium]